MSDELLECERRPVSRYGSWGAACFKSGSGTEGWNSADSLLAERWSHRTKVMGRNVLAQTLFPMASFNDVALGVQTRPRRGG